MRTPGLLINRASTQAASAVDDDVDSGQDSVPVQSRQAESAVDDGDDVQFDEVAQLGGSAAASKTAGPAEFEREHGSGHVLVGSAVAEHLIQTEPVESLAVERQLGTPVLQADQMARVAGHG